MDTLATISNPIATFILGLFAGFLTSYMSEKGKNLATKEDIGEMTKKVEEIKSLTPEILSS